MYSCGRAKFHGMLLIVLNGIEMLDDGILVCQVDAF